MKKENNFKRIGHILKNNQFYKAKRSGAAGFNFLKLVELWPEIVGISLSEHTHPLKYKDKKISIITDHSVFSHQLKFLERPIILKIYKLFPILEGRISNIIFLNDNKKFHLQKNSLFSQKAKKSKAKEINLFDPRNVALRKDAEEKFANMKDPEMKQLLIDIFIQSNQQV